MPFIEHDLKTLLADMPHPFLQSEVKTIMLQLLSAVAYCHANWIVRVKTCFAPHPALIPWFSAWPSSVFTNPAAS